MVIDHSIHPQATTFTFNSKFQCYKSPASSQTDHFRFSTFFSSSFSTTYHSLYLFRLLCSGDRSISISADCRWIWRNIENPLNVVLYFWSAYYRYETVSNRGFSFLFSILSVFISDASAGLLNCHRYSRTIGGRWCSNPWSQSREVVSSYCFYFKVL